MNRIIALCADVQSAEAKPATPSVFAALPELFLPAFWEKMNEFASDPHKAHAVIDELDQLGQQGASVSPKVATNMLSVLQTARATLRTASSRRMEPAPCCV